MVSTVDLTKNNTETTKTSHTDKKKIVTYLW